jgi:hypothetical protein
MALPGVPQTFAIENAREMADKLDWEIEKYDNEIDQQKKLWRGFNCAVTAWHIIDWLWREQKEKGEPKLRNFRTERKKECWALLPCQYIANASKHSGVDRNKNDSIKVVVRPKGTDLGDWPQAILESQKSAHWEIVIITPQGETDALQIFRIVHQYLFPLCLKSEEALESEEALARARPAASDGKPSGKKLEC